jgi:hypothetical protein
MLAYQSAIGNRQSSREGSQRKADILFKVVMRREVEDEMKKTIRKKQISS